MLKQRYARKFHQQVKIIFIVECFGRWYTEHNSRRE